MSLHSGDPDINKLSVCLHYFAHIDKWQQWESLTPTPCEIRGLLKLKKKKKIREKLALVKHHPPTHLPDILLFFETFGNIKTTQKTQKIA